MPSRESFLSSETRKTNCHYCGYLCAFDATVEDGVVTELTPDPTRYPYDIKVVSRCRRWRMNIPKLYDEERVNYPLRRVGKRGSGKFERVTWAEAIDDISTRLKALIDENGPWTVASAIGGPHAVYWPLHRFMNLLGSPNNMGIGPICWNPRIWMDTLTYGWSIECDFRPDKTGCLILWGTNPAESDNSLFWSNISKYVKDGGKLIVVDPRLCMSAQHATLWLHPYPGTDTVLAYAIARALIEEGLVDRDFVDQWCSGFDEFKEAAFSRTLEEASKITTCSVEDIVQAAHLFADHGPGALISGRGVDQIGPNVAPLHRVLASLRALVGCVDREGGCHINQYPHFMSELELEMSSELSMEAREHGLNEDKGLQSYTGYANVWPRLATHGRYLPMRYLTSALPVRVWNAAITHEPYRVSALFCNAANPMVTYADTNLVKQALESMDLVVDLNYLITPTGQMADYILPVASAIERPAFQAQGGVSDFCYGGPAAVEPLYERKEDYEVFRELGLAMGQNPEYWPAKNLSEELARVVERAGVSWDYFKVTGIVAGSSYYNKQCFPQPGDEDKPMGFATESGKIELANPFLEKLGAGLVPQWFPVPGVHAPCAGAKGVEGPIEGAWRPTEDCVTLITGARKQPYWASCYFEIDDFRKAHPKPTVEMSAATAERLGLTEGDECTIERVDDPDTRVLQYVHIVEMVDDVASAEYGWWFPERQMGEPGFSGCFESNINLLTRGTVDMESEPLIGTWIYNGIPCRIRKKG